MVRASYAQGEPGLNVGDLRVGLRLPEGTVAMVGADQVGDHHTFGGGEIVCFIQSEGENESDGNN